MLRIAHYLILSLLLYQCSPLQNSNSLLSPSLKVTAEETLEIAELYTQHRWIGNSELAFHGTDKDGITVNTPDINYRDRRGRKRGWWKSNHENIGIPYKWGGFDTPLGFDLKLSKGYYAGDSFIPQKRDQLELGVSRHSTGIDCSGFISRCWKLARHHSTRELPIISRDLGNFRLLRKGDIINKTNDHAILFSHFAEENTFIGYEAVSEEIGKVRKQRFYLNYFIKNGYRPLRYNNLITTSPQPNFPQTITKPQFNEKSNPSTVTPQQRWGLPQAQQQLHPQKQTHRPLQKQPPRPPLEPLLLQ